MSLRDRFDGYEAPGEEEAGERGWDVVRAAYDEGKRERARPRPRRLSLRPLAVAAAGAVLVALVVTPAGAAVADWIEEVVEREPRDAGPAPLRLPAQGRLLVDTAGGPWIVSRDGSKRLLGDYEASGWSPGGLFLVATSGRDLLALEPNGRVRWQRTAPARISGARWAPSGFRIAYLSGTGLRVVAGDGTGDGLLAEGVSSTPPAWRPGKVHVLAYADASGRVIVSETDAQRELWRSGAGDPPKQLAWSSDGERLLVVGAATIRVFAREGRLLYTLPTSAALVAFAPEGHQFAALRRQARGTGHEVVLLAADPDPRGPRRLFAAPGALGGLAWSPDGRWLLISWDANNQWIFVSVDGKFSVRTGDRIAERFDPGGAGPQVPSLVAWCC